jgi:XTP/dITP diphosphohydrolase
MKRVLVATNNAGKVTELRALLSGVDVDLVTLRELDHIEVEETGSTFVENAEIKAAGYARQIGLPAIADDSGLEVDALDGRPGVLSARYGGADMPFKKKIEMLLDEIKNSARENRAARFVCAISVTDKNGNILETKTGICHGSIAFSARGEGGFGYDPVFIPDGYDKTFGELSSAIKSKISHRGRAFREIIPFLRHFIAN